MHQDLNACCPAIIRDARPRVNSAADRIAGVAWPQSKSRAQSHGIRAPRRPRLSRSAPGFFSYCDGAYPFSGVTRGLDPRVHPLRKSVFAKKMDCRVKPGNDEGETVPTILHLFERDPL
jgi:hypothetical protein